MLRPASWTLRGGQPGTSSRSPRHQHAPYPHAPYPCVCDARQARQKRRGGLQASAKELALAGAWESLEQAVSLAAPDRARRRH
jgi:hypothetical protein